MTLALLLWVIAPLTLLGLLALRYWRETVEQEPGFDWADWQQWWAMESREDEDA